MKNHLNKETYTSLFWLIAGVAICISAYDISLGSLTNPGPGLFPFLVGVGLFVLSTANLFINMRKTLQFGDKDEADEIKGKTDVVMVLVALLTYALTLDYLGFLIGTCLFLAFLLHMTGSQPWYIVFFGSVVGSLVIYVIFKIWIETPLPTGLLGIGAVV